MRKNKGGVISLQEAMRMLSDKNTLLIDVRSKEEFKKFHLRGSINIPIENFQILTPRYIKNKGQRVIIYCSSGVRSLAAYELLLDLGYYNVYDVYGGIGEA